MREQEHESRRVDTLRAEVERRRGWELKKLVFEQALKKAKTEEAQKAEKRVKDAANKADKLSRLDLKAAEYQRMLKGRDGEIELMAAEEAAMVQHLKNLEVARLKAIEAANLHQDAVTQANWEADQAEASRRLAEMSERNTMECEEHRCIVAWSELGQAEADERRKRQEAAEKLATEKWKELTALVKPHKIHQDPNFKSLRSKGLSNMDVIAKASDSKLREAGLSKVVAKKLLSVCRSAVEERTRSEEEEALKVAKVLERKKSLAKVERKRSLKESFKEEEKLRQSFREEEEEAKVVETVEEEDED